MTKIVEVLDYDSKSINCLLSKFLNIASIETLLKTKRDEQILLTGKRHASPQQDVVI